MNSGKLVLAGITSVMLVSASAIPSLAQQANGDNPGAMGPRGPMAFAMRMLDTNSDGKITREEFDADKAKIFGEIDKNSDKKISYDEAKAWARDVMAKMPGPGAAGPGAGPDGGQAAAADGKAPPAPADGKAPPPPPVGDKADAGPDGFPGPMGGPGGMRGPGGDRDWRHGPKGPHGRHHMGGMGPGHMDPRERLAQMFLRADANDDGFISQEEFNVMADRMFTRMDRNGDGVLDMKDMWRPHMMRDHRPGEGPKGGPRKG